MAAHSNLPSWAKASKASGHGHNPNLPSWAGKTDPAGVEVLSAPKGTKKQHHRGFFGKVARYSGLELVGNLSKDVGETALGVGPGLINVGKAAGHDLNKNLHGHGTGILQGGGDIEKKIVKPIAKQYKDYYGHDLLHHLYTHPLQPILDVATVATAGAGAGAKLGVLKTDRAAIVTRSPRKAATGKGPAHSDISSTAPLVKLREQTAAKARAARPLGGIGGGDHKIVGVGGELKRYGKQIQAEATQKALGRTVAHEPYHKATRRLSPDEWTALHLRAIDIHPNDLAHLWRGTPAEAVAKDPKIRALVETPTKRMAAAEPELRALSQEGEKLFKKKGLLKDETAAARPDLTKRQAAEILGRPVAEVTGQPYYFPHTIEPAKNVNPLNATGGGKGVARKPGTTKQNTGALALHGKLHLRGDVLGPEFLRRVKYVKYDEIHNALVRGAVRVTRQDLEQQHGGKLPKGWEYIRQNTSTRIPPTLRVEGEKHAPLSAIVPNPDDLHTSSLADGFSTVNANEAHQSGGSYYIAPKSTITAATGEFTRSGNFTRHFIKRPLSVWRAAVLGLRVGFFTNNLVGNSVMYAAKTGGNGALRDLFGAIHETHGPKVAKKILDNQATPPELRADLYKEFFPEQVRGTFGRTQTPATSPAHVAGRKVTEAGRAITGAIPRVTSKVAEEMPRRALIRHYIRHSPEFKRVYSTLPKQTRTFENAARQVLEGKGGPAFQRHVSKKVNEALGDYLNLSPTERNVLRNTLPFYAWYKAITTTTYHLAADTPLRANVLGQIGRIGKEQSDAALGEVPSFLRGAVGLGDGKNGTKRVLATQGLDPYSTLEQIRSGVVENVDNLGLNPFLMAALQTYAKAQNQYQSSGHIAPGKLASSALGQMVRTLPPSRLAKPLPPSKLYPNRDRHSELLSYLGVPVKEYNPHVAAQQARKGR